jgi:hypothetical protein
MKCILNACMDISNNTHDKYYSGEATVGRRGRYWSFLSNAAQRNEAVVAVKLSWVVIISIIYTIINNVYFI